MPENYYFNSARNFADLDSALNIEVIFIDRNSHGLQIRDI